MTSIVLYKTNTINRHLLIFLFSLLLSIVFFLFFTSLDGYLEGSIDRNGYLQSFLRRESYFDHFEEHSLLSYFTREWLWNKGGLYLVNLFGSPEYFLSFTSFLIVFVFTFFIFSKTSFLYYPFILNPLFVDLAFSQLRIGAAFVFLTLAYAGRGRKLFWIPLALMSLSIHTSSIIFVFGYLLIYRFEKLELLKSELWRFKFTVCIAFIASFMMGPLREIILTFVNDRRAEYPDVSSGFQYMSYWLFLFITFILVNKRVAFDSLSLFGIFILAIASFNTLFGFYSVRFIAVGLPFFAYTIYSSLHLVGLRLFIVFSYLCFNVLLWYYWWQKF